MTSSRQSPRPPVFFWITVGMLALLFLGGTIAAVFLVFEAKSINRSGGWGWLLIGAIYVAAATAVCFACALSAVASLFRRESHRPWSIAILAISVLVVSVCGPGLVKAANGLRRQYQESGRSPKKTPRRTEDSMPPITNPPAADKRSNGPVIRAVADPQFPELK